MSTPMSELPPIPQRVRVRDVPVTVSMPGVLIQQLETTTPWTGEGAEGPEGARLHEIIQGGTRRNSGRGHSMRFTFSLPRDRESLVYLRERVAFEGDVAEQDGLQSVRAAVIKALQQLDHLLGEFPAVQAK
jgi:hypothetical protein